MAKVWVLLVITLLLAVIVSLYFPRYSIIVFCAFIIPTILIVK